MTDIDWALDAAHTGGEYLDGVRPGWYREINTRALDISQDVNCILGQLYGSFQIAAHDILGLTLEEVFAYGFHARPEDSRMVTRRLMYVSNDTCFPDLRNPAYCAMHSELEYAWKELIQERLEADDLVTAA